MIDMTQGKPITVITKFMFPLLMGNVLQQTYNLVDSVVVGNFVGADALASVSNSFIIMFLLISLFGGIGMGATILISQFLGAQQKEDIKRTVDTMYITLFVGGIILSVVGFFTAPFFLKLLNTPEGPITEMSTVYLQTIFIGLIANFGYGVNNGILQGIGDGKSSLLFLGIATVINIALDLLFVAVFDMGVLGVALATIIAQLFSFLFGIWYINKKITVFKIRFKRMEFSADILVKSLKIGLPAALQNMMTSIGIMIVQRLINGYGPIFMAGFSAGSKIDAFVFMPIMSFANAVTTYVGQNIGARKFDRVKAGVRTTLWLSLALSVLLSVFCILMSKFLLRAFVNDPQVIAVGQEYVLRVMAGFPFLAILFIYMAAVRGAGQTTVPLITTIFSLLGGRVVSAYIYAHYFGPANIFWCYATDWIIGAILLGVYYYAGTWKKKAMQFIDDEKPTTEGIEA